MSWDGKCPPSDLVDSPLTCQTMTGGGELRAHSLMVRALTRITTYVLEEGRMVENIQEQGNFLICTIIFLSTLTLVTVFNWIFNLKNGHEFETYRRQINLSSDQIKRLGYGQGPLDLLYGGVSTPMESLRGRTSRRAVEEFGGEMMMDIEQDESEIGTMEYTTSAETTDLSE
ncbi:hypothetical protein WDU94_001760 [Cyamophila willieti]